MSSVSGVLPAVGFDFVFDAQFDAHLLVYQQPVIQSSTWNENVHPQKCRRIGFSHMTDTLAILLTRCGANNSDLSPSNLEW